MHIISKKAFVEACKKYPAQKQHTMEVFKILKKGTFKSPLELKEVFNSLDNFKYKDKWWVIDVGGNKLRMIAFIQFVQNRIYVKHIVSHADYDKLTKHYRSEGRS